MIDPRPGGTGVDYRAAGLTDIQVIKAVQNTAVLIPPGMRRRLVMLYGRIATPLIG